MPKKLALITTETKTFTSKKLIKEAKAAGARLKVINPLKVSFVTEKGKTDVLYQGKRLGKFDACYRKTITTPKAKCLEHFLWKAGAKTVNPLDKRGLHSGGKFGVYQLLAQNGIAVPKSFLLTDLTEKKLCLDYLDNRFPLIAKTNAGTHGIGVLIIDSPQTFDSLADYLFGEEIVSELIIQEFVKTSFGKDKRIIVLAGKVLAAVERRNEKGDFRSNVYLGAKVYKTSLSGQEEKMAIKAMEVLNLNFGGLDILYGKKGPVFTEANAPCDYSFVEKKTGVPITRKIIKFLLA